MEIHRLKQMKDGYPEQLFNSLYNSTSELRKSLAYQIDNRRYGVTKDIILSWFDDKFIFVFNKYYDTMDEDTLRGFIINSLRTFKMRILRKAYSHDSEFYISHVELEGDSNNINRIKEEAPLDDNDLERVITFLKSKLSKEAFTVLQIQLNPPPYILSKLKKSNSHIPNNLILEYLNLVSTPSNKRFISNVRKEIEEVIGSAKSYFNN